MYAVYHRQSGHCLVQQVKLADRLLARTIGLLGRRRLSPEQGLWLSPCSAVHTHFMLFSIDVIFLSAEHEVLALYATLPPFRMTRLIRRAQSALEIAAGTLLGCNLAVGDYLEFRRQPENELRKGALDGQA